MSTTPIREHLERFYNDIKSYVRDSCVCSDTDFKESVMLDVMNYAVHLAAADGNISQEERTKIAELAIRCRRKSGLSTCASATFYRKITARMCPILMFR